MEYVRRLLEQEPSRRNAQTQRPRSGSNNPAARSGGLGVSPGYPPPRGGLCARWPARRRRSSHAG